MGRGARRSRIDQVRLLIASALLPIATASGTAHDRDARAYNACIVRHAEDLLVCEGPRQAYELEPSIARARSIADSFGPDGR